MKSLYPGQAVEYHGPEPDVILPMSAANLRQVMVALLKAAYGAASPDRDLRIEVSGRETAAGVEFSISDNGRGLTAEEQQRQPGTVRPAPTRRQRP